MKVFAAVWGFISRLGSDVRGQDFVEYALVACCLAATVVFFLPNMAATIGTVFSRIGDSLAHAASQG